MPLPDVVIAGAGLIGLACALECERRGLRVTVLERGEALRQASWAAAGMLAAHDRANPAALQPLAHHSITLYPAFLDAIRERSGLDVRIETEWVLEPDAATQEGRPMPGGFAGEGFCYRREQSLDPRRLATAIAGAVRASSIHLRENTPVETIHSSSSGALIHTAFAQIACGAYLDCTGAWSAGLTRPAKGQMLRVHAPGALAVQDRDNVVVRTEQVYMVPRLDGSVVIGATVEDAGFDTTVHDADLSELRGRAASLLPAMADAPETGRWAGLRPDTPDHLPCLGATGDRTFAATGHFRNGVLLAPATARVMAGLILGEAPFLDLRAFDPQRFGKTAAPHGQPGAVFEHV